MLSLVAGCVLVLSATLATDQVWASTYVPGQYRDGIYIRPHFTASPEVAAELDWLVERKEADRALKAKEHGPVIRHRLPMKKPDLSSS